MSDDVTRTTVKFSPRKVIESRDDYYRAFDGWEIKKIDGKWNFCSSDPGMSAKLIFIELTQEDFDYARKTNPSWDEMCWYMKGKGYF